MTTASHRSAFTLIEMSIVLVIIGLITGGILLDRALIDAARVRSTISDLEKYKSAVSAFKLKYNCLPGDCPNATDFFGQLTGGEFSCTDADFLQSGWWNNHPWGGMPSTGSCNGYGNGKLTNASTGWQLPDAGNSLFWQHLYLAGLITAPTLYTTPGSGGVPQGQYYISPPTAITAYGFTVGYIDASLWGPASSRVWTSVLNKNVFYLTYLNVWDSGLVINALTPAQAFAIDSKMDDGQIGSGSVVGGTNNAYPIDITVDPSYSPAYCFTPSNATPNKATPNKYSYNLSEPNAVCNLGFIAGF
jgi:prepilin-type N-terminal cleavage/methylation domain-containing protein